MSGHEPRRYDAEDVCGEISEVREQLERIADCLERLVALRDMTGRDEYEEERYG